MKKVLVMKHQFDGMTWNTEIPEEKFLSFIKEHTNEDAEVLVYDNMRDEGEKVSFEFISHDEFRESCINGVIYDEGCSREEAERRVDGDAE